MDKQLEKIIAQETIKLIVEQSEDPTQAHLDDLKKIQSLFKRICRIMNAQFAKKIKKLEAAREKEEDPEAFIRGVQDELGSRKFNPGSGFAGSTAGEDSQSYTVKSGDTYWDLATKFLGNPRRWPEIVSANSGLLSGRPRRKFAKTPGKLPVIRPGDKLTIPSK